MTLSIYLSIKLYWQQLSVLSVCAVIDQILTEALWNSGDRRERLYFIKPSAHVEDECNRVFGVREQ